MLAAVALISIPILFQVPRTSGLADTLLEAFPFVLAGAALLVLPFTAPGPMRTAGVVVAAFLVTAPLWWFFVWGAVESAQAPDSVASFHVLVLPEDENATYDLLLPLPLDEQGRAPPALAQIAEWDRAFRVEHHDGVPMLRVQGKGALDRSWRHEYGDRSEDWLDHGWRTEPPAFGPSNATTRVTIVLDYEGTSRFCSGETTVAGVLEPHGASFLRRRGGVACA